MIDKLKDLYANALQNSDITIEYILYLIIFVLIVIIIMFARNTLNMKHNNCNKLNKIYTNFPTISPVSSNASVLNNSLRDFYIKTAYNCCSPGYFKNSFVDLCALKKIIQQGARCLDFEIYSVDDEPVIATSTESEFDIKETYNSVEFSKAMSMVRDYAFSFATCPNPTDPLILHFRIKSNNKVIYKKMARSIQKYLESYVLDKDYSYESDGHNLSALPIKNFLNKVIIVVDKSNPLFEDTELNEFVNFSSNAVFMRSLRTDDVIYTHDMDELVNYNKKNMCIVLPNVDYKDNNPDSSTVMKFGCQMIGMSFQNFDANMEFYDLFFDKKGYAFALKPDQLRYIPTTIDIPKSPSKNISYGTRKIKSDYYNFDI